ncbi:hypothetical protein Egran_03243 [Elaphomyces granulatus]|uniref:Uncharacterized protein n=1 Tax=Elaphomyces granulatus TaxID=519963 RepID=A0A232LY43_9EURO|nr:hypothetical protein Egran_03243 [Elaphomyces granulatus]
MRTQDEVSDKLKVSKSSQLQAPSVARTNNAPLSMPSPGSRYEHEAQTPTRAALSNFYKIRDIRVIAAQSPLSFNNQKCGVASRSETVTSKPSQPQSPLAIAARITCQSPCNLQLYRLRRHGGNHQQIYKGLHH